MSLIFTSQKGFTNQAGCYETKSTSKGKQDCSKEPKFSNKPQNKCLQNNLVYCINMPLWFEDQNIIRNKNFFGKYGTITSVVISLVDQQKTKIPNSKYVQVYIKYENQKEAAIAIAAVNDIKYAFRIIRVTYGTNRLCNNYLRNEKCKIKNCFYLHDEKTCIKIQGPLKTNFQRQKNIAIQIIKKNLGYYFKKIQEQQHVDLGKRVIVQNKGQSFPSLKQTIDKLVEKNIISKNAYMKAYQQFVSTKKKMSQSIKKIEYIRLKVTQNNKFDIKDSALREISNIKRNYSVQKKQKSKEKQPIHCQFLMRNIVKSLEEKIELGSSEKKKGKQQKKYISKQDKIEIFRQIYIDRDFWQKQILQTQQSQGTHSQNPQHLSEKCQSSPVFSQAKVLSEKLALMKDSFYIQQGTYQEFSQSNYILSRLEHKLLKRRLIKQSLFQFTIGLPFQQKEKEFNKVTELLKVQINKLK